MDNPLLVLDLCTGYLSYQHGLWSHETMHRDLKA